MRLRVQLVVLLLVLSPAGCRLRQHSSAPTAPPALAGDPRHPAAAQGWVDVRLFFGMGPADHPEQGVSEAKWRAFLDEEVTPRFPDGLSVADVYGQWQGRDQRRVERLRSKMLMILCIDSQENRAKMDAIRSAWKQRTGDQSVLRVIEPADVSF
jgi:Protein of unknown function (DUF3574).